MHCTNCNVEWEYAAIRCPDCGNRLTDRVTASVSSADDWLLAVCDEASFMSAFYIGDGIPDKKRQNVCEHYPIGSDELVALLDCTVFGSAKVGLAIGRKGIYWNTDWTTETARRKLAWEAFVTREITLDEMSIDLGRGDKIDVAALGKDGRAAALVWLRQLQETARKFA